MEDSKGVYRWWSRTNHGLSLQLSRPVYHIYHAWSSTDSQNRGACTLGDRDVLPLAGR